MNLHSVALTTLREGDECAQTAVTQPLGYPHISSLPPVLSPTILQLPELCSILILKYDSLRDILLSNITYYSISHYCDRVMGGVWWRIEEKPTALWHKVSTIYLTS